MIHLLQRICVKPHERDTQDKVPNRGAWRFGPHPWICPGITAWNLPKPCPFGFLWRLHYIDMTGWIIGHWWSISLQILCPPWGQGWDRTEKFTPIIMVCSPGHQPHPEGLSKGYLINISPGLVERGLVMNNKAPVSPLWLRNIFRNWGQETKYFNRRSCHCSYHSEIPRIWGAVSPEPGTKTKIYIYYKWDFSCTSGCTISVYLQT